MREGLVMRKEVGFEREVGVCHAVRKGGKTAAGESGTRSLTSSPDSHTDTGTNITVCTARSSFHTRTSCFLFRPVVVPVSRNVCLR